MASCQGYCFFFEQKTAYDVSTRDWSSDVCSSDLVEPELLAVAVDVVDDLLQAPRVEGRARSEERRVGKESRSRWSPYHYKKLEGRHLCGLSAHVDQSDFMIWIARMHGH